MNRLTLAPPLFVLLSLVQPACAEDIPREATPAANALTIRLYAVDERDEPAATTRALTSSLLRAAGIDSRVTLCGAAHPDAACRLPLASSELAMRLSRGAAVTTGNAPLPMGTSLVDPTRRTGVLATLYVDRIESLAAATGTDAGVILARAIAHEAAHLVLGTNEHGSLGLMRPLWSRDMLRREPDSTWVFTADEGERLRQALAVRLNITP